MRKELQKLADLRVEEAAALASRGKQQGAYYLAGFAIECALKACIAKKTRRHQFPPRRDYVQKLYSHDLTELLKLAGLEKQLEAAMAQNWALAVNWGVVKGWDVESRYEMKGLKGRDMLRAVSSPHGVLQWIKLHW